ncbi:hypothetical protein [Mesobacterium pallidum]|uniref:hypothetical protein n=1 Tax=Mesobacterium pallidum TaxID=2872037 RepID=UPI001EE2F375|nr:hypothetical protein [Mesobacterium pallidum]
MTVRNRIKRAFPSQVSRFFRRSGIEAAGGGRRWEGSRSLSAPQNYSSVIPLPLDPDT